MPAKGTGSADGGGIGRGTFQAAGRTAGRRRRLTADRSTGSADRRNDTRFFPRLRTLMRGIVAPLRGGDDGTAYPMVIEDRRDLASEVGEAEGRRLADDEGGGTGIAHEVDARLPARRGQAHGPHVAGAQVEVEALRIVEVGTEPVAAVRKLLGDDRSSRARTGQVAGGLPGNVRLGDLCRIKRVLKARKDGRPRSMRRLADAAGIETDEGLLALRTHRGNVTRLHCRKRLREGRSQNDAVLPGRRARGSRGGLDLLAGGALEGTGSRDGIGRGADSDAQRVGGPVGRRVKSLEPAPGGVGLRMQGSVLEVVAGTREFGAQVVVGEAGGGVFVPDDEVRGVAPAELGEGAAAFVQRGVPLLAGGLRGGDAVEQRIRRGVRGRVLIRHATPVPEGRIPAEPRTGTERTKHRRTVDAKEERRKAGDAPA